MKIREIVFQDFRSFRGERRISFVDPVTDTVRPVTVLAGANGCGKTTVLDAIEAVLRFFHAKSSLEVPFISQELLKEVQEDGAISLTIEISEKDVLGSLDFYDEIFQTMSLYAGKNPLNNNFDGVLRTSERKVTPRLEKWRESVSQMIAGITNEGEGVDLYGGILSFPSERRLAVIKGGTISEPSSEIEHEWFFHLQSKDEWRGSLEELWVWRNYLDLEQDTQNRSYLAPFVKGVEYILGENRQITISKGRVYVPVGWQEPGKERPLVRLDQLPSGEQQVLLLFGELARRMRPGAVVMIDEIENSLHPTLQRLVMWNLRRLAQEWDAQVIVTTHSREIISTATGGAFINLDYPENRFDVPVLEAENEKEQA